MVDEDMMQGVCGLAAAAVAVVASPAPAADGAVIFLPFRGGVSIDVHVAVEDVTNVNEHEAQILDMRGDLVTMVDSYASRPRADGGYAGGREVYVRLLDLGRRTERSATLAASCRHGVTAADPVVTWKADGSGYTVNLTSADPVWVAATGD